MTKPDTHRTSGPLLTEGSAIWGKRTYRMSFCILTGLLFAWSYLAESWRVFWTAMPSLVFLLLISEFLITWTRTSRRMTDLCRILESGDVDGYLAGTDQEIAAESCKDCEHVLFINRSAGLFFKGEWQKAIQELEGMDPGKLPAIYSELYKLNKAASLIMLNRLDEAEALLTQSFQSGKPAKKTTMLEVGRQCNLAAIAFYRGDYTKSRALFESYLDYERPPIYKALSYYYLGCMDLKQGNQEEGRKKFQQAATAAPHTFIPRLVQDYQG